MFFSIDDPNFILKYDILGVCEIWLNKGNENLVVPEYKFSNFQIEVCLTHDNVTNEGILKKINFLYTYKSQNLSKRKSKPKKQSNKWYDFSSYEINRKMKSIAKISQKDPTNMDIRRHNYSNLESNQVWYECSMYCNTQQGFKINGSVTKPFNSYREGKTRMRVKPITIQPYVVDKSCKHIFLKDTHIYCLMYADDIVILSETEEGLKNSLNKLVMHNEKWYFEVNHKKTKTMIFQAQTLKKVNMVINKQPIKDVKQFKYLGNIKYWQF